MIDPKALQKLLDELTVKLEDMQHLKQLDPATVAELLALKSKMDEMPANLRADFQNFLDTIPNASKEGAPIMDAEARELAKLCSKASLQRYTQAALSSSALDGAEAELNKALAITPGRVPLAMLAPDPADIVKATTNVDPTVRSSMWLDRLFADSAAMYAGVTFDQVPPGVAAYPATTAGATGAQKGRGEAAADAAWTVGVTELKPSSNVVRAVFSSEDAYRVPGLESALRRDLGMAVRHAVDLAIFTGDAGANEDAGDVTGLTGIDKLDEQTLTQANKEKGEDTLAAFAAMLDGKGAGGLEDLRIVSSVPANTLWTGTIAVANQAVTIRELMARNGLRYMPRGDLSDATTAGKFGAVVGRGRNIRGSAVAAIWSDFELIRDHYSGAAKREVALTATVFWNFGVVRKENWARLKFVA